ncbi:hypothetical protein HK096_004651 [Nowakowskiella sp. JEL0078]|nr:hypothetical protein HK096_004651 [Nowakowskiella sp. JEL0078]
MPDVSRSASPCSNRLPNSINYPQVPFEHSPSSLALRSQLMHNISTAPCSKFEQFLDQPSSEFTLFANLENSHSNLDQQVHSFQNSQLNFSEDRSFETQKIYPRKYIPVIHDRKNLICPNARDVYMYSSASYPSLDDLQTYSPFRDISDHQRGIEVSEKYYSYQDSFSGLSNSASFQAFQPNIWQESSPRLPSFSEYQAFQISWKEKMDRQRSFNSINYQQNKQSDKNHLQRKKKNHISITPKSSIFKNYETNPQLKESRSYDYRINQKVNTDSSGSESKNRHVSEESDCWEFGHAPSIEDNSNPNWRFNPIQATNLSQSHEMPFIDIAEPLITPVDSLFKCNNSKSKKKSIKFGSKSPSEVHHEKNSPNLSIFEQLTLSHDTDPLDSQNKKSNPDDLKKRDENVWKDFSKNVQKNYQAEDLNQNFISNKAHQLLKPDY